MSLNDRSDVIERGKNNAHAGLISQDGIKLTKRIVFVLPTDSAYYKTVLIIPRRQRRQRKNK